MSRRASRGVTSRPGVREEKDRLIARYVGENPHHPGVADAWLSEWGVPVWAVVGHHAAVGAEESRVASDYDVPVEAIEAALAYYRRHKAVIDARIAANAPSVA